MLNKKKETKTTVKADEREVKLDATPLDTDELDKVTGGSLSGVKYTETKKISEDTKSKI